MNRSKTFLAWFRALNRIEITGFEPYILSPGTKFRLLEDKTQLRAENVSMALRCFNNLWNSIGKNNPAVPAECEDWPDIIRDALYFAEQMSWQKAEDISGLEKHQLLLRLANRADDGKRVKIGYYTIEEQNGGKIERVWHLGNIGCEQDSYCCCGRLESNNYPTHYICISDVEENL